jgi:hypothetical protein
MKCEVVPLPHSSLILALSDFWFFAFLKKRVRGIHITFDEEV